MPEQKKMTEMFQPRKQT